MTPPVTQLDQRLPPSQVLARWCENGLFPQQCGNPGMHCEHVEKYSGKFYPHLTLGAREAVGRYCHYCSGLVCRHPLVMATMMQSSDFCQCCVNLAVLILVHFLLSYAQSR